VHVLRKAERIVSAGRRCVRLRRDSSGIVRSVLCCLLSTCLLTQAARADNLDDFIQGELRKLHIPGLSVGIVKDGRVIREKGYGFANLELSVPASASTVYQIASITKTFTATAIMMLVQEGRLSLDDKITARLPELPEAWANVTVRQLLTHTSGIKDFTKFSILLTAKSLTLWRTGRWSSCPEPNGNTTTRDIFCWGC
jgi:CubicO group peptidase (beta-lactamase class C family)